LKCFFCKDACRLYSSDFRVLVPIAIDFCPFVLTEDFVVFVGWNRRCYTYENTICSKV